MNTMLNQARHTAGISDSIKYVNDQDIVRRVTDALARADGAAPEEFEYTIHEDINPTVLRLLANHEHTRWELSFDARDHEVTVTSERDVLVDGVRVEATEEPIYE